MQKRMIASTLMAGALAATSIAPAHANGGFTATGPHGNTVSGSHEGNGGYNHGGGYYTRIVTCAALAITASALTLGGALCAVVS